VRGVEQLRVTGEHARRHVLEDERGGEQRHQVPVLEARRVPVDEGANALELVRAERVQLELARRDAQPQQLLAQHRGVTALVGAVLLDAGLEPLRRLARGELGELRAFRVLFAEQVDLQQQRFAFAALM
jgi:hypothetical protein